MKVRSLEVGVESISRWRKGDGVGLPPATGPDTVFMPQGRALDEVLARPTLNDRLPHLLLRPLTIDPSLLEPAALTEARRAVQKRFAAAAQKASGGRNAALLAEAAALLADDSEMDEDVQAALAALLRG